VLLAGGAAGNSGGVGGAIPGSGGANSTEIDIDGIPTLPIIAEIMDGHGGILPVLANLHRGRDGRYQVSDKQVATLMASFYPAGQYEDLCHNFLFGKQIDGTGEIVRLGNGDVCDAMLSSGDS
jgi:hypothetical protein